MSRRPAGPTATASARCRRPTGPPSSCWTSSSPDGDRVHARWTQHGHHLAPINGRPPTGRPLTEKASAVYRVEAGRIVEYWIQIDRQGLPARLTPGEA
ncbi:ester cyclase [Kitasatospora sp. NPDC091207]|uniref:ester cyclase n=1 Tax=Kitasatospora sp. NPDC091207 TaxID=3364083 RepID=UPI003812FBC2